MSYLRFEKAVMTNLEESLHRELLRTNRSGAYSASTAIRANITVCSLFPYLSLMMRTTFCCRRSTVR